MAARKKIPLFAISALKGEGLKALVEAIARTLAGLVEKDGSPAPPANEQGGQS
jgi:putative protein kinase ArgK-like GTPase of G3E family